MDFFLSFLSFDGKLQWPAPLFPGKAKIAVGTQGLRLKSGFGCGLMGRVFR